MYLFITISVTNLLPLKHVSLHNQSKCYHQVNYQPIHDGHHFQMTTVSLYEISKKVMQELLVQFILL